MTSRRNRKLPYLHRNWLKATDHWNAKMGNKVSSLSPDSGDKVAEPQEQPARAPKRRRLENDYDGFPMFEGHSSTPRALRLEILKVTHKDSPRLKNGIMHGIVPPNVKAMRARCKITIYGRKSGQRVVLHVDSQLCEIMVYKNPAHASQMARLSAIKPFHIPEEKIFLERDDDDVFGLANSYTVSIEIESAGDPKWPPSELIPGNDEDTFFNRSLPARQWSLTGTIENLFNSRNRKEIWLRVKKHPQHETSTNFLINVDVRWMTAISRQQTMKEKDTLPSITVFDPNEPVVPAVNGTVNGINGVNGHHDLVPPANGDAMDVDAVSVSLEDVNVGESPNRPQRRGPKVNYNVKDMWSKTIGKEPRKRRRGEDKPSQQDQHKVTYNIPPVEVHTDRLSCLLCAAEHNQVNQLRAHYGSHHQFDFHFDTTRANVGHFVTVTRKASSNESPIRPTIYQLGLPTKPLDLDKYVDGDESWVTSRLGPENSFDDVVFGDDGGVFEPMPIVKQAKVVKKRRPPKVVKVPDNNQPLFDPLSKARLEPGAVIKQHQIDDSWLLLKHRDSLQDFLDVEEEEKEYMKEWDSLILKKHLSSEAYIPRELLGFVERKAAWIIAKPSRVEEFSKHLSLLLARQVIDETTLLEASQTIQDARNRSEESQPAEQAAPAAAIEPRRKDPRFCCAECGEQVAVSKLLVCGNKQCNNRVYHKTCVDNPDEASKQRRRWKCKTCVAPAA
ncbi:hypothetical protein B0H66DRAFT_336038 [Apodospora peruviana]|uniref:Zinc finger PHD-type domain-containing protein n=1 Tax=Apodospora peruviana TaxID=516989 RepID=A0AAE0M160_9PEZI|nr:hypothetical protein B0H66DRAFT_336038 [Apodospora peruviana]